MLNLKGCETLIFLGFLEKTRPEIERVDKEPIVRSSSWRWPGHGDGSLAARFRI